MYVYKPFYFFQKGDDKLVPLDVKVKRWSGGFKTSDGVLPRRGPLRSPDVPLDVPSRPKLECVRTTRVVGSSLHPSSPVNWLPTRTGPLLSPWNVPVSLMTTIVFFLSLLVSNLTSLFLKFSFPFCTFASYSLSKSSSFRVSLHYSTF